MASTEYLVRWPRVAIRHVCRQDYEELTTLAEESAEMLNRWLSARENSVEAFESYLARFERPAYEGFVICLLSTGAIVGGVNSCGRSLTSLIPRKRRVVMWEVAPRDAGAVGVDDRVQQVA